jgi:hypothetical protein
MKRRDHVLALCAASAFTCGIAGGAIADDWKCESKFGPNDQIGNANYITPAKTLAATKLVTKGKSYHLGIEANSKTPAYPPRYISISVVQPGQQAGQTIGPHKLTYNDDMIIGWNGVGPQLDGFGHIGIDNVYYNCFKEAEIGQITGLTKLGIETVPPIATRGIVLDMAGLMGVETIKEGTAFNVAEIEAAMKRQGISSIEQGDVVLFYTGWLKLLGKDDKRYSSVEPGLGREGARYLAEKGVAAVGADTWAVESFRSRRMPRLSRFTKSSCPEQRIHHREHEYRSWSRTRRGSSSSRSGRRPDRRRTGDVIPSQSSKRASRAGGLSVACSFTFGPSGSGGPEAPARPPPCRPAAGWSTDPVQELVWKASPSAGLFVGRLHALGYARPAKHPNSLG